MLLAARQSMLTGVYRPTAKDYVQDGLVNMWDGIENAGLGMWGVNNPNATDWPPLVHDDQSSGVWGSGANAVYDSVAHCYDTNGVAFISGSHVFTMEQMSARGLTVDIVISAPVVGSSGTWIVKSQRYGWLEVPGDYIDAKPIGAGSTGPKMQIPINKVHCITSTSEYNSATFYKDVKLYINGNYTGLSVSASMNSFYGFSIPGASTSSTVPRARVYALRFYDRCLTDEEIAHNFSIDKIRFNLPD